VLVKHGFAASLGCRAAPTVAVTAKVTVAPLQACASSFQAADGNNTRAIQQDSSSQSVDT